MWELIRLNKRRSTMLMLFMLVLLMVLGFVIGSAVVPSVGMTMSEYDAQAQGVTPKMAFNPAGGLAGMAIAFVIWAVQAFIAYFYGGNILLSVSGAKRIEKADHPQLFNVVEEMTIAASLPKMPEVYIMDDMSMNAFATGRDPEHAAVAVTAGLLGTLNRDQLQGVVAHEVAHIVHRDVLYMTMVGIMMGTIVMISEVFLRSMFYSSMMGRNRRYSSSKREGGGAQALIMVAAIVLAVLAPILAQLIYFAISRRREYLADAGSAVYTRYPEGLASALEVLSKDINPLHSANRATAPMYIVNPLRAEGSRPLNMTRTHPPLKDRIKVLRGIAGGVSYAKYQEAFQRATSKSSCGMPNAALKSEADQPIRQASADSTLGLSGGSRSQMREAGDLLRKVNDYLFLSCTCGMRIKLPPEFKHDHVTCPRCKKSLTVPVAQLAAVSAVADQLGQPETATPRSQANQVQQVTRQGKGWMSFQCACGAVKNIGPSFQAGETRCNKCGRTIQVIDA